jgi:PAS domain S-box-containing protein
METPILFKRSARMVTRLGPQSDAARLIAAIAVLVAYVAGFIPLYHLAGTDVLQLALALVVAIGYLLGFWPGLLAGLLSFPLNALLLKLAGEDAWQVLTRPGSLQIAVLVLVLGAILGGLRDVGEQMKRELDARKEVEEARRESEERYRIVAESASEAIFTVDERSRIVFANPAAEIIFGYAIPEMLGQDFSVLVPDKNGSSGSPAGENGKGSIAAMRDRWQRGEFSGRHKSGGEIPLEISFGEYSKDGRHSYTGIVRDITERKQVEAALRDAKEAAERANGAKSEFLSRMSHELRTPLNAILGFGQLLEMDPLEGEQKESVEQILKAGRHLLTLINEVLDIARIEAGRLSMSPEPVKVDDLMKETWELVRPLASQRKITMGPGSSLDACGKYVIADRQRLKQVLLNFLSNAVKYNREGGSLEMACSEPVPGVLRIRVSDTGSGIPADRLPHMFIPFERLGAEETGIEGTGLGLALSKRLVEAMGAKIGVDTKVGVGSTFYVDFALAEGPVERFERISDTLPEDEQQEEKAAKQRTILYIEDNISNFKLIQRVLSYRPGIGLLAAMQGHIGLELAAQHVPDLILLDLNLPDMHGSEVLEQLHENPKLRNIPVVVISADATPGQIQRLMTQGARAYLTKPLDIRQFLELVDETLKGLEV